MARLTAKGAFGAGLSVTHGGVSLSGIEEGAVTWLAPLKGKAGAVSAALENQIGMGLPEVGRSTVKGGARVVWAGPGQVFVIGPEIEPIAGAALVDQSSGWARLALEGAGAEAVLARLVPVDLRASVFGKEATARTQLGHMACSLTRTGPLRFEIMVFRSMAGTAVHDLERAMTMLAARGALAD